MILIEHTKIASKIEHTRLVDIVSKAEIYYDPSDKSSEVTYDDELMKDYNEFMKVMDECYEQSSSEEKVQEPNEIENKWIIRIELDETAMLDMNITNEDIHYTIKTVYGNHVSCFYSDYNSDNKIVFRIRLNNKQMKIKSNASFTQEDYIYIVKSFQDKLMNEMVIRGIKNIEKVNIREIKNYKSYDDETGNYNKKDCYVLDTIGTNLIDILALDYIESHKCFTNDVIEMYNVLGIEAARKSLFNEIIDVMEFDSTYINHHHLHLLCDRMTCNEKMVSIFRHGINKDNIGPIAKASFEETSEMFLQAARHGELDNMRGVSANIMCGQEGNYGTSSFQTYIDNDKMYSMQDEMEHGEDSDDELDLEHMISMVENEVDEDEYCSIGNLKMSNELNNHVLKSGNEVTENVLEEDDYELDI